jgi:hypothetical protein
MKSLKSLSLNVYAVEASLAPDAESGQLVIHGDGSEAVTVNLGVQAILRISLLMGQMAIELESARMMAGKSTTLRGVPAEASETPVATPVHLVEELRTLRTADRGCLLEVKGLQGEHFRISLEADQASSLLSALLESGARRVQ